MSEQEDDTQGEFQYSIRHRPTKLKNFMASDAVKEIAQDVISGKNHKSAVLITGSTGTGKTTLAHILAAEINGLKYGTPTTDVHYFNAGDTRGVDDVRGLANYYGRVPQNNKNVIIVDEVHALTGQAASALLTPLEAPRKNRIFLLCTDQPEKLLETIVGRCIPINLQLPDTKTLVDHLGKILKKEDALTEVSDKDKKKLLKAVTQATGNAPRASLQLLENAVTAYGKFNDIKKLLASEILRTPVGEIDKISIRIVLGMMKLNELGSEKGDRDKKMPKMISLLQTMCRDLHTVEGFPLINRIAFHVENFAMEVVTGAQIKQAWPLKSAAKQSDIVLDPNVIIGLLEDTITLKERAGQFNVTASSLLLSYVLQSGERLVFPKG